jgi:predicted alpha/beta superfamily hydrolase
MPVTLTRRAGLLLGLAALLPAGAQAGARLETLDLPPPKGRLRARRVRVWLPPDFRPDGRAHAVVYAHDGQNLFDAKESYAGVPWALDQALLTLAERLPPTLVVAIDNTPDRWNEYLPAAPLRGLPDKRIERLGGRFGSDAGLLADDYLDYLAAVVKPAVDARYRTRAEPAHSALMGSSMGGLISLYGLLRKPAQFGRAACLSTHWPLGDVDAPPDDRAAAQQAWQDGAARGRRLYMDHGDQDLDAHYPALQAQQDAKLLAAGWQRGRDFTSLAFPGTGHSESAWQARLHQPLQFLFPEQA